jgi:hypothetical protein
VARIAAVRARHAVSRLWRHDSIGQFRADLDIKGDDPKEGLVDLKVGGYYSHDQ